MNRCNPAGMKKSIGKPAITDIMANVWGVLRIVFEYRDDDKLSFSLQHEQKLERFMQAMAAAEGNSFGELEPVANVGVSSASLKYLNGEDRLGYLEGGVGLLATQSLK